MGVIGPGGPAVAAGDPGRQAQLAAQAGHPLAAGMSRSSRVRASSRRRRRTSSSEAESSGPAPENFWRPRRSMFRRIPNSRATCDTG